MQRPEEGPTASPRFSELDEVLSKKLEEHERNMLQVRKIVTDQQRWLTKGKKEKDARGGSAEQQQGGGKGGEEGDNRSKVKATRLVYDYVTQQPVEMDESNIIKKSQRFSAFDFQQQHRLDEAQRREQAAAAAGSQTGNNGEKKTKRERRAQTMLMESDAKVTGKPHISSKSQDLAKSTRSESTDASGTVGGGGDAGKRMRIEDRLMRLEQERVERLNEQRAQQEAEDREAARAERDSAARLRAMHSASLPVDGSLAAHAAKDEARRRVKGALIEEEELAEMTATPRLSARSERMAARRRQKELGSRDLPIEDSLLVRDEQAKATKWLRIQALNASEVPGRPQVNPTSVALASMVRAREALDVDLSFDPMADEQQQQQPSQQSGDVHERLYQSARRHGRDAQLHETAMQRQLRELVDENLQETHQPAITPRAHTLKRKDGHTVANDLYNQALSQKERREQLVAAAQQLQEEKRKSQRPIINPVSEMITARLPESSRERLCKPKPRPSSVPAGVSRSFSPTLNRRSAAIAERATKVKVLLSKNPNRNNAEQATTTLSDLHTVNKRVAHQVRLEELHADGTRRKEKLRALQEDVAREELEECTFYPATAGAGQDIGGKRRNVFEPLGAPTLQERMEKWEQRREQRLTEVRDHVDDEELKGCTFKPKTTVNSEELKVPNAGDEWSTLYGGDGKAWGYNEFVTRQKEARKRKEEEAIMREHVFSTGRKWTGEPTVPKPPRLGSPRRVREAVEPASQEDVANRHATLWGGLDQFPAGSPNGRKKEVKAADAMHAAQVAMRNAGIPLDMNMVPSATSAEHSSIGRSGVDESANTSGFYDRYKAVLNKEWGSDLFRHTTSHMDRSLGAGRSPYTLARSGDANDDSQDGGTPGLWAVQDGAGLAQPATAPGGSASQSVLERARAALSKAQRTAEDQK